MGCHSAPISTPEGMVVTDSLEYPKALKRAVSEVYPAYPKLHQYKLLIRFDEEFDGSFMQAQPQVATLWKSKKNRGYIIKVKPIFVAGADTLFTHQIPDTVLQGWIAHEMGHLMDYRERTGLEMIWLGVKYSLLDDYIAEVEKAADLYAIKAGFTEHIIATKTFIQRDGTFPEWYLKKIEEFYLSPKEVRSLQKQLNQ